MPQGNFGRESLPLLVLLPGLDGTGELFARFRDAIGERCETRVLRYPATEPMGYAQLGPLVQAALPRDRPIVLLGESFSGPLSITLAARGIPNVVGLILCATFVKNPQPVLVAFRDLIARVPARHVPGFVWHHALMNRGSDDELEEAFLRAVAQVSPDVLSARMHELARVDVSAQLVAVRVPVMYMQARRDRVVPVRSTREVLECRPDIEHLTLDASHLVLQTAPEESARVVLQFLHRTAQK